MTALGKTLVFFNLLFALVTGGLIVLVFLTRTNWRVGMEAAVQEKDAAVAALKLTQDTAAQQKLDAEAARKKLEEEIGDLRKQIAGKDAEIAGLKQRVAQSQKEAAEQLALTQAGSTEILRLQKERDQQAQQLKAVNDDLVKTRKDLADTTQRETYARLRGDSLERTLSTAREELENYKRKYEELLARSGPSNNTPATPNIPRVPSIDTRGRVTQTDGTHAVISLGSDNGIERGHVLQVFRLNPPLHLGTLTITKANAHEAVGDFQPSERGRRIAVGDQVDTKIAR